jgi:hypothetical protein
MDYVFMYVELRFRQGMLFVFLLNPHSSGHDKLRFMQASGKSVCKAVDEVPAFFECLNGEGSEKISDFFKLPDESLFIISFDHLGELLMVFEESEQ